MKKLSSLSRASLLLISLFTVDKLLALGRSALSLNRFGLTAQFDAFNAANNIPDMLFALISGGAIAMAFIPILTSAMTNKGRDTMWNIFSRVANITFIVTAVVSCYVAFSAEWLVKAKAGVTPGFTPELQGLVAELMRLNLIGTLIFSVSGLVMAGLHTNKHFLLPALAPIMYNAGQIFGVLFLTPRYGIHGLVYGAILGAAFHLAIQIPGLIKYKFRWTPSVKINDPEMIQTLWMILPRLATMFCIQLTFVARDNLASNLHFEGSVSALTFGWMIMQVPETILGTAIATAMLPTLSEYAARGDWAGFRQTIEKAIRILISLTLPIAAVMAAGIHPLVRTIFGLDEAGATLLTWTTRVYLISLCGYTIQEIGARSFYARKEALYPLATILVRIAFYLTIGNIAVKFFSAVGAPAIAFTEISITVEAIVMFVLLSGKLHEPIRVNRILLKGLIAAALSGIITYAVALYLPGGATVTALIGMIVGGLIALAIVWKEARLIFNM